MISSLALAVSTFCSMQRMVCAENCVGIAMS